MADARKDKNVGIPPLVYEAMRVYSRKHRLVMKDVVGDILRNFLSSEEVVQKVFLQGVTKGMEADYARALDALKVGMRAVPIVGTTTGGSADAPIEVDVTGEGETRTVEEPDLALRPAPHGEALADTPAPGPGRPRRAPRGRKQDRRRSAREPATGNSQH